MAPVARSARALVAPGPALTAMEADVIVVGAGASGLACARSLVAAGIDVVVLEARDRIGGRIQTLREDGEVVEAGAHVVHGANAATWSILAEGGIVAEPLEHTRITVWIDGRSYAVHDLAAAGVLPPWSLEEFVVRAGRAGGSVAALFDDLPLATLERRVGEDWLLQTWGAPPEELDADELGRIRRASAAGDGQFVVVGGYDQVAAQLARGLEVRLGTTVRRIVTRARSVEVVADGGEVFGARAVVLTVPPTVVAGGALSFEPGLPLEKMKAARALPLCDAVVLVLRLATPAARSSWDFVVGGSSGFWQSRAGSRAVVGVLKGPPAARARELAAETSFSAAVAALLPTAAATDVEDVEVVDWGADPLAQGAFTYPGVSDAEAPAAWAAPIAASLFFAGEATCWECHRGLVHGAIESGLRCAAEVLACLSRAQRAATAGSVHLGRRRRRRSVS
jgi:monoamine oxidase